MLAIVLWAAFCIGMIVIEVRESHRIDRETVRRRGW